MEVAQEAVAGLLHLGEGGEPPRVLRVQVELGLPVVVGRAQEAVHRGAQMALLLLLHAAIVVGVGDHHPFAVPGLVVTRDHARGGQEALADGAAAFLRFAEPPAELVGEPGVLRPVMPAVRLVVSLLVVGDLGDDVVFGQRPVVAGHT